MKIYYSPVVSTKTISYTFEDETITVTFGAETDTIDLSGVTTKVYSWNIPTELSRNPVISAERIDGELYVSLTNYIGENATEAERFPDYITV